MKRIVLFTAILGFFTACDLEEINENPNVPQEVPLSTLLPPAQKGLADAQGGRIFRYTNIFSQQLKGVDGQELLVENYQPDELFIGDVWSDLYVGSMINLKIIIEQGDREGSPHYSGVARILMAQALGLLTDVWGNVPYNQALEGASFPHPVYDDQESIYGDIQNLLDRAILDLELPESTFTLGNDDIIYNGDLQLWINAAHALKARYLIHTTKRNPNVSEEIVTVLESAFSGSAQDMEYPYLGTGTDINPLSSFYTITPYAEIDPQFIALLDSLGDPRIAFSFKIIPFTGGRRRPGDYYASATSPVKLISYLEQLYILSEARLRNGDVPGAEESLADAVTLSMQEVSDMEIQEEAVNAYLDQHAALTGNFEEDLRKIMIQKYIGLFTTPEPWTVYRRTGYPELAGNNGSEIPRRLLYPQSERLRNLNFPSPAPTMYDRFWWDQ